MQIMQTLRKSYGMPWLSAAKTQVHRLNLPHEDKINGALEEGEPMELAPSSIALSHQSDREHIRFLERQSMLLAKTET
ncbi:hypothetical protein BAUCODRAFT_121592 [Baudoinia panamericana UAMH 10762]|uniref:Uncharacterized protein n=1 Tax=Baudoinia panamericana (strain UAMH 10762) TaxID=717646 RepID=M2MK66_BAUPA|nr:uncharacterized protein BAUCODRAFT_121592 [Baudoinia panamericana UAMH 10762]EMC97081.1 hypothetical protein BAUCODRAFT_121592 [Baudoinia panamericana UAMH 10762]